MALNAFVPSAPFDNVGDKTVELRNSIGLPTCYVVLAEPPESLIVLQTESDEHAPTTVIWLSAQDAGRLVRGESLTDADYYASFTDFFETLLQMEREDREEWAGA